MEWTPTRVKQALAARGLAPLHRLGQHFLTDPRVLERIADAVGDPKRACLEIGAGLGGLTQVLCEHGHEVVAVEIDRGLAAYLRETPFGDRVTIVEADALKVELEACIDPAGNVLCGNLPYYLTSPLLHRVLALPFAAYVVMVQREVAERLEAPEHRTDRGTLSVLAQAVGPVRRLFDVPPSAFYPQPDVASAVVRIERQPDHGLAGEDFRHLERIVGTVFRYRRKSLRHGLREGFGWSADTAEILLAGTGLEGRARPADLSLADWWTLTQGVREFGLWRDAE